MPKSCDTKGRRRIPSNEPRIVRRRETTARASRHGAAAEGRLHWQAVDVGHGVFGPIDAPQVLDELLDAWQVPAPCMRAAWASSNTRQGPIVSPAPVQFMRIECA